MQKEDNDRKVANSVVARQPPARQPTKTTTAHANILGLWLNLYLDNLPKFENVFVWICISSEIT